VSAASIESLVQQIHGASTRFVLVTTGGGSLAISGLLTAGGASRSVIEAAVPYSAEALAAWLGARPEHFCSSPTARAMAMVAWRRALSYEPQHADHLAGIACTASLASDRPKRGPHRAHLALQTAAETVALSLELEKGRRTRAGEEQVVSGLILNLVAEACGLAERWDLQLAAGEPLERARTAAPGPWQDLLAGRAPRVAVGLAPANVLPRSKPLVFPGAFNPLHAGHRRMAQIAEEILGRPVEFELSIANVDKPPLDFIEIEGRARQFTAGETLWLTHAPTFVEKAQLFGGPTFVVGADTIARIADPRYYAASPAAAQAAIERLASCGADFLVFGRAVGGELHTLSSVNLPPALARICKEVPAEVFCDGISSTALRQQPK